ncbi:mannosyltransferase putative-domain-containing protein [Gorgonomyces haynaldii]|nr:mannosyltransferase putative-domain-containing protein [Gorgonomyces haynaldii]
MKWTRLLILLVLFIGGWFMIPKFESHITREQTVKQLIQQHEYTNLKQSAQLLREYKYCFAVLSLGDAFDENEQKMCKSIINRLNQSKLLDWGTSIPSLFRSFKDKGMVVPVYDKGFYHALMAIKGIRDIHQSQIPIYCFYNGPGDLKQSFQDELRSIPNVHVLDLQQTFPKIKFGGWSAKPAMLLAAPCQECILFDSDVWFVQSPETAFKQAQYRETGMLIYKDRTVFEDRTPARQWIVDVVPESEYSSLLNLRFMKTTTMHEVESGMVVMDKRRRFVAALTLAYLNSAPITPESHKTFHGEKETFWIGPLIVGEPFSVDPHLPLGFGHWNGTKDRFCSTQMAHADQDGRVFWVHGGVIENKFNLGSTLQSFTHYIEESGEYTFPDPSNICMKLNGKTPQLFEDKKGLEIINSTQQLWNKIKPKNYVYVQEETKHRNTDGEWIPNE